MLFSVILVIAIGVPLEILVSYLEELTKPILGIANIIQATLSLASLEFTILFLRVGSKPAILMVVLYSLLPITRNMRTGIRNIPDQTLEAAKGIGVTRTQTLIKIRIPMALPVIMAGIRAPAVAAVGLMTITVPIGAGDPGYLVYSGVRTSNNMRIPAGVVPACILALVIDSFMGVLERVTVPEGLTIGNSQTNRPVRKSTKPIVSLLCLCLLMASVGDRLMRGVSKGTLHIGSSDMSEQLILGNMYADIIETKTDYKVQKDPSLGGVQICLSAL